MRRRKGGIGQVILIIVGMGALLAALSLFGGDLVELTVWFFTKIWSIIIGVKDAFLGMPVFRDIFS